MIMASNPRDPERPDREEQQRRSWSAAALGVALIIACGAVVLIWVGISLWSWWWSR
jgi:hypothetical protein